jgi:4-alpha-glucanotransferase
VPKFQFVLLIHGHQPVGNFDNVIEQAYAHSYLPFVQLLEKHPKIRIGLHYSGCLLEWLEKTHPEYFELLRALTARGQVEMVGGGFYEPILISIPPEDRREQIDRLGDYIEKHFGQRPRGGWLTERVWEPQLPSTLAAAGIQYTLVDDNQFLSAGFEPSQLRGAFVAEDMGSCIHLIPGLKLLRYLIPYRDPSETVGFLRTAAAEHPGGFIATGDDCEKFGVWPGTYEHCYRDGWIERFYAALEQEHEWLEMATPGDAVGSHVPLGRADLPSASYEEMMEWALPTPARLRFESIEKEFASRPDMQPFLRGGIWRSFMAKYPEANLLQKKMLHVSAKIRRLALSRRRGNAFHAAREKAESLLLRAQCNDPYWHGVFGGVYSPHLRTAPWRALAEAESIADGLTHRDALWAESKSCDYDADGREEICFTSGTYSAVLCPADGGTICALDFRPSKVTLINSIARRVEAYHSRLKNLASSAAQGAVSIHEQMRAKEPGLEKLLRYDRWARHCFRTLVFPATQSFADYEQLRLDAQPGIAAGTYAASELSGMGVTLCHKAADGWHARKKISFTPQDGVFELSGDLELSAAAPGAVQVGIETVLNFLAPNEVDRYIEAGGERHPLRWSARVAASELRVVDLYQNAAVTLSAPRAREFWVSPIETVSDSEYGFERVYQGSQILAVWAVEIKAGETWRGGLSLKVDRAR